MNNLNSCLKNYSFYRNTKTRRKLQFKIPDLMSREGNGKPLVQYIFFNTLMCTNSFRRKHFNESLFLLS
jgi:hypothetical protein